MRREFGMRWGVLAAAVALVAAACGSSGTPSSQTGTGTGAQSTYFVQADFDKQMAERNVTPTGPAGQLWLQAISPTMVDTTRYRKTSQFNLCFSNAAVDNPWRAVGLKDTLAEVKLHPEIASFTPVDAGGSDDKQIADIAELVAGKKCDALMVSPNTTAPLTPAIEKACQAGLPVIDFDRGVNTDCPITFVHPIGGYAYGAEAAEFIARKVKKGGNVLALRILPGVDVLETRWSAAKVIFDKNNVHVAGVEFTQGDDTRVRQLVNDYLRRFGHIDGVWMDAGHSTLAAVQAFQDAGKPVPAITGEDQEDFLTKWQADKLDGNAPTYPSYQWRTAVIAATMVMKGEPVPHDWVLPEPEITSANLAQYVNPNMPPLHYALCGCENMPGYPEYWGGHR